MSRTSRDNVPEERGARLWNNLSADVENSQAQNLFKKIWKISRESFCELRYIIIFFSYFD